jgi:serine/threonine-protein kinase
MGLAIDDFDDVSSPGADVLIEIPGFQVEALLGKGSAGSVFRAKDPERDRTVAIKVLNAEHTSDELQRERLIREAGIMESIDHPNVVGIYDRIETGGALGLVMEFVDGPSLRQLLRRESPLEIERAVALFRDMASALEAIHEQGLTHRDLKPENVLINESGSPKVTDFGIAFSEDEAAPRLTLTGMTLGTVGYMSPEQADGLPVDPRSDIYSLAVIFHEMITGVDPDGFLDPPQLFRRELSDGIDEAIVRALSPLPEERFSSMGEFAEAVGG